jgi:hypothetical protein
MNIIQIVLELWVSVLQDWFSPCRRPCLRIQIMAGFVMQFPPASCYFLFVKIFPSALRSHIAVDVSCGETVAGCYGQVSRHSRLIWLRAAFCRRKFSHTLVGAPRLAMYGHVCKQVVPVCAPPGFILTANKVCLLSETSVRLYDPQALWSFLVLLGQR